MRTPYARLPGPTETDVTVVGAGLTGLWTAYHLSQADPSLRIVVVERDHVGFGASGRNGGWCSALFPVSLHSIARRHGHGAAVRMQQAMHATVRDVVDVCRVEGIDADLTMAGTIDLVRNDAQLERARARLAEARAFGFGDDDLRWLEPDEAAAICRATRVLGATFTPHCATVHPAKLVHGLAAVVAARGVVIHEDTTVERIDRGVVQTDRGRIRAEVVVRATEGYSATVDGAWRDRRGVIPIYSMMVATEPLDAAIWHQIGLDDRPTFADGRNMVIYGQRTADGRLAFGGRGAPYHFGSRVRPEFDTDPGVLDALRHTLAELFPVLDHTRITHHWGGPLGVARDFHPTVSFDRDRCFAWAGAYVGDGVAATHLAGRTLADLIVGNDSEFVRLPWVGHRSRRWEPEPLRWAGVNAVRVAAHLGDRLEHRPDRRGATLVGRLVRAVTGH